MFEYTTFSDGCIILGSWPEVLPIIRNIGPFPLTVTDPPYGGIVNESWDKNVTVQDLLRWTAAITQMTLPQGALYWFGGYGQPYNRMFFTWLVSVEHLQSWQIAMPITWSKKRAYGIQYNYLSTREEIAYCIKGDIKKPLTFNVPLLDEKRGYAGYNLKYPAKSKYKRRTAVWTDVTELMRNKKHPCEKPVKLIEIMIATSSNQGDIVFDPFAGSGTTGEACRNLGRRFVLIERERKYYEIAKARLS